MTWTDDDGMMIKKVLSTAYIINARPTDSMEMWCKFKAMLFILRHIYRAENKPQSIQMLLHYMTVKRCPHLGSLCTVQKRRSCRSIKSCCFNAKWGQSWTSCNRSEWAIWYANTTRGSPSHRVNKWRDCTVSRRCRALHIGVTTFVGRNHWTDIFLDNKSRGKVRRICGMFQSSPCCEGRNT